MSAELSPSAAEPRDDRAALIAMAARGELATGLSASQLKKLRLMLEAVVSAGEDFQENLKEFAGPEMSGLPAHLRTMCGMGIGYLRHSRDLLEALRRGRGRTPKKGRKA